MVVRSSWRCRGAVISLLFTLVFLAALPLAQGGPSAKAATTWNVGMYGDDHTQDFKFDPAVINITVGDSVNWTSVIGTHTSTSNPNQAEWWDSGSVPPDKSFVRTFTVAGSYGFHCLIDPQMNGTVVVQQPIPEFPGFVSITAVAMAVLMGLIVERKLRD
jgi:plastocyanin